MQDCYGISERKFLSKLFLLWYFGAATDGLREQKMHAKNANRSAIAMVLSANYTAQLSFFKNWIASNEGESPAMESPYAMAYEGHRVPFSLCVSARLVVMLVTWQF